MALARQKFPKSPAPKAVYTGSIPVGASGSAGLPRLKFEFPTLGQAKTPRKHAPG